MKDICKRAPMSIPLANKPGMIKSVQLANLLRNQTYLFLTNAFIAKELSIHTSSICAQPALPIDVIIYKLIWL